MKIVRVRDKRRSAYGHKRRWQYVTVTEPTVCVNPAKMCAAQLDDDAAAELVTRLTIMSPGSDVEAVDIDG